MNLPLQHCWALTLALIVDGWSPIRSNFVLVLCAPTAAVSPIHKEVEHGVPVAGGGGTERANADGAGF